MQTCNLPPPKLILDSKPVALIRRLIQRHAPLQARVRYDTIVGRWAILNDKNEPIRHITHGFMENVTFSSARVKVPSLGCGGGKSDIIGIASGLLREGIYVPDANRLHHLSFLSGNFIDADHNVILSASRLQLLPNRRALFQS